MPNSIPLFRVHEVSYSYRQVTALQQLSLEIWPNERIALLGANGSGKSTLLRLLGALSFAQSGSVSFVGDPLTRQRLDDAAFFYPFRRRVGIVFQNPDVQLFNASVFDEVAFGPLQLGVGRDEVIAKVEKTLEFMAIGGLRDRPPHRLSGGEKKRVALASVLVLDPDVLLLDEPTAALDPASSAQIIRLLSSWEGGSKTIITATHDLDVLEEIADRCLVLESGRVIAEGTPVKLLHDVDLLVRSGLLHPHAHTHEHGADSPHPHVHRRT